MHATDSDIVDLLGVDVVAASLGVANLGMERDNIQFQPSAPLSPLPFKNLPLELPAGTTASQGREVGAM